MKDLLNAYQWNSVMLALRSFEELFARQMPG